MHVFKVQLAKETFKFSASHFTLLSPTEAERLHGHNYYVSIECTIASLGALGMAFEFNTLKPLVKALAENWDERVLIPAKSLHLILGDEMIEEEPHLTVGFQRRSYRFPKSEVALLETENITSEELARLFAMKLSLEWMKSSGVGADPTLVDRVQNLTVKIEETRGQSASFSLENPLRRSEGT
ncbi:6-pyruvoyl tetrahydropterin synthase family protein [soil metagenome]